MAKLPARPSLGLRPGRGKVAPRDRGHGGQPGRNGGDAAGAAKDALAGLRAAYAALGMPREVFLRRYVLPAAGGAAAITVLLHLVVLPILPGWLRVPLGLAVPALLAGAIAMLPVLLRDRRRVAIDNAIHFYITRAGVLAKANLSAIEVLRRLNDKASYGPLAEDSERIVFLVTRWNMSISEACRAVSRSTPSVIYAEFLERLAYALDSGEELGAFLISEQAVVMEDFATMYQASLYNIEALKDAFLSLSMSVVFMVVFGVVSPVLTGFRAEDFLLYAVVFFALIDGIFLLMILGKAPSDPLWHPPTGTTPRERVLRRALPPTVAAGLAVGAGLLLAGAQPHLALVAGMSPPVVAGLLVRREEALVRRRDEYYPPFVRALGSATSASGGVARQVLRRLRHHNFGPLGEPIERLYRRLHLRVDDTASWAAFASESGSHLVMKFNAMFVEGTRSGADPEAVGRMISANDVRILNLRKHRRQAAGSFRSMLLGFMAGTAFTMHIGVGVLRVLVGLFADMGGADMAGVFPLAAPAAVDFALIGLLVQVSLVVHALLGSMMTQAVEGGSYLGGYVDFVLMMWVATLAGLASEQVFKGFFGV